MEYEVRSEGEPEKTMKISATAEDRVFKLTPEGRPSVCSTTSNDFDRE